ncbi:YncE family protein [Brucepastera parasyntrophica]|uniref:YncE family protein n=1 Tax=Brucepastera parasyntrophica TaxID=2880008 RepID=UPI00210E23EC|nr:YncE family protein [Brucepastera parasyntrophica]ULQ60916.1 YncE family protein [Brucepastera parasyntrophica]
MIYLPPAWLLLCAGIFILLPLTNCTGEKNIPGLRDTDKIPEYDNAESPGSNTESLKITFPDSQDFPYTVMVKAAPPDIKIDCAGKELVPSERSGGIFSLRLESGSNSLRFYSPGYLTEYLRPEEISGRLRKDILQIKLEPALGKYQLVTEIGTGEQPKSAFFSPDGKRIFVPLLNESGIDVFSFSPGNNQDMLVFEQRLTVPGSGAKGFVEALADAERGELWVSNMEDHKVHIYDLGTLAYKTGIKTGGAMPKVIVQNPGGTLTAVSNWQSRDISLFDSDSKKVVARIPAGGTPRGMVFSPDGKLLYTAIFDEATVAVIDIALQKVIRNFKLHSGPGACRHILYGSGKLYVTDMAAGRVITADAENGKVLRAVYVGPNLNTMVFSPDKKYLYVSSRGKNNPEDYTKPGPDFGSVSVLSAEDLSPAGRIWGRNQPTGLAVSPDGKFFVFTDFLDANMELYETAF